MYQTYCQGFVFLIILVLSSCKTIDEGEVDYVRTVSGLATVSLHEGACSEKLYQQSLHTRDGFSRNCYESLHRKYTDVPMIRKGESISVHLMQAFIQDATESKSTMETIRGVATNAEVAVIANVCEQGIKGCGLEFGPSSDAKGRVVYFSNGVKAKQYLNFSYLPVYGPIEYQGGPLIIQLAIIELDNMTEEQKALLTKLAEIGKQKFAPASNVLSVLDGLGSSLLSGGGDDVIFRYTFTMMPDGADKGYAFPTISAGNFAFVKKKTIELEQEKQIWDELKFDSLTGRLVKKCSNKDANLAQYRDVEKKKATETIDYSPCTRSSDGKTHGYKDYRDNTYMTLQVQSGFSPRTLDKSQTLNELLNELSGSLPKNAEQLQKDIEKLTESYYQATTLDNLKAPLSSMALYSAKNKQSLLDQFEISAHIFENSLAQVISDKSCDAEKDPCPYMLTNEQILNVISHARLLLTKLGYKGSLDAVLPLDFKLEAYTNKTVGNTIASTLISAYKKHEQTRHYQTLSTILRDIHHTVAKLIQLAQSEKPELDSTSVVNAGVKLLAFLEALLDEQQKVKLTQCSIKPDQKVCQHLLTQTQLKAINLEMFHFLDTLKASPQQCNSNGVNLAQQRLAAFIVSNFISITQAQATTSTKAQLGQLIRTQLNALTEQQLGADKSTLVNLITSNLNTMSKEQLQALNKTSLVPLSIIDADNIVVFMHCLLTPKES
ncbi:hypothetical protein PA25_24680 [Pseudoalteromonas sp. A25]|uniref:hypothetical protein n=1 Tax=Pseudoalteromonas sp. A25 TaxID=116092 RepID=UPI001260DA49|nr:hypothetical protein [Pseudoalteromonas sp. A25]BBN82483.1 hypothetical protein PA25_24680 [Pseudoalteromonas sp. A25]